jgi:pSer/pThr/pTyr-binding forkhead associated (FHA) protein
MARIKWSGPQGDQIFPLGGDPFSVGRLPSNSLALPDDQAVSREHARIERDGLSYVVHDLNSRNGTFVERGDQKWRVDGKLTLQPGDVIHVGATRLLFEDPEAERPQPADAGVTFVPGQTLVGRVLPVPKEDQPQ